MKPVYDRINHEKTTIEYEVNALIRPLRRQTSKYAVMGLVLLALFRANTNIA